MSGVYTPRGAPVPLSSPRLASTPGVPLPPQPLAAQFACGVPIVGSGAYPVRCASPLPGGPPLPVTTPLTTVTSSPVPAWRAVAPASVAVPTITTVRVTTPAQSRDTTPLRTRNPAPVMPVAAGVAGWNGMPMPTAACSSSSVAAPMVTMSPAPSGRFIRVAAPSTAAVPVAVSGSTTPMTLEGAPAVPTSAAVLTPPHSRQATPTRVHPGQMTPPPSVPPSAVIRVLPAAATASVTPSFTPTSMARVVTPPVPLLTHEVRSCGAITPPGSASASVCVSVGRPTWVPVPSSPRGRCSSIGTPPGSLPPLSPRILSRPSTPPVPLLMPAETQNIPMPRWTRPSRIVVRSLDPSRVSVSPVTVRRNISPHPQGASYAAGAAVPKARPCSRSQERPSGGGAAAGPEGVRLVSPRGSASEPLNDAAAGGGTFGNSQAADLAAAAAAVAAAAAASLDACAPAKVDAEPRAQPEPQQGLQEATSTYTADPLIRNAPAPRVNVSLSGSSDGRRATLEYYRRARADSRQQANVDLSGGSSLAARRASMKEVTPDGTPCTSPAMSGWRRSIDSDLDYVQRSRLASLESSNGGHRGRLDSIQSGGSNAEGTPIRSYASAIQSEPFAVGPAPTILPPRRGTGSEASEISPAACPRDDNASPVSRSPERVEPREASEYRPTDDALALMSKEINALKARCVGLETKLTEKDAQVRELRDAQELQEYQRKNAMEKAERAARELERAERQVDELTIRSADLQHQLRHADRSKAQDLESSIMADRSGERPVESHSSFVNADFAAELRDHDIYDDDELSPDDTIGSESTLAALRQRLYVPEQRAVLEQRIGQLSQSPDRTERSSRGRSRSASPGGSVTSAPRGGYAASEDRAETYSSAWSYDAQEAPPERPSRQAPLTPRSSPGQGSARQVRGAAGPPALNTARRASRRSSKGAAAAVAAAAAKANSAAAARRRGAGGGGWERPWA